MMISKLTTKTLSLLAMLFCLFSQCATVVSNWELEWKFVDMTGNDIENGKHWSWLVTADGAGVGNIEIGNDTVFNSTLHINLSAIHYDSKSDENAMKKSNAILKAIIVLDKKAVVDTQFTWDELNFTIAYFERSKCKNQNVSKKTFRIEL